jgi:uncharacterized membrane protein
MSEPESLATDEGLDRHIRRHAYDRLLMLSDGIFAIATTLAALEIKAPDGIGGDLAGLAHAMARPILAYLISFAVIAVFWISHRNLFARLRHVDGIITVLTLAMLCLVALIPAMLHGVYAPGGGETPFRLYALTMIACGVVNAGMWLYAAARPGMMAAEVKWADRWTRAAGSVVMPLVFLPILLVPIDRFVGTVIPLTLVLLIFRRVLLPRFFARLAK